MFSELKQQVSIFSLKLSYFDLKSGFNTLTLAIVTNFLILFVSIPLQI